MSIIFITLFYFSFYQCGGISHRLDLDDTFASKDEVAHAVRDQLQVGG